MRSFSLHRHVLRHVALDPAQVRVLSPQCLGPTDVRQGSVSFHADLGAMRWWCRVNERHVLDARLTDARVRAGFQRLSRMGGVASRYRTLAHVARDVTVLGAGDHDRTAVGLDIDVVRIDGYELTAEWFLVIESPRYRSLLVARELAGAPSTGGGADGRRFEGLTSHDPEVVAAARDAVDRVCADVASAVVGQHGPGC